MLDIRDLRLRHANSIRNTPTGHALGATLDEVERLRAVIADAAEHHENSRKTWAKMQWVKQSEINYNVTYHEVRRDVLRAALEGGGEA